MKQRRFLLSKEMLHRREELRYSLYLLRRSPLALVGAAIIATIIALALLAPFIAPYGPETRLYDQKLEAPNASHLFGTDNLGADIFSRVLYGYRLDMAISLGVVAIAVTIGTILGCVAGFAGGKTDETLMRMTDVFLAVPGLILAMAIGAVLGRTPTNLVFALAIAWWPIYARLMRGQVQVEKQKLYVDAGRAAGASSYRLLFRHILPNSIHPVMVNATLDLGAVILTAAALSFLGFGVQPGAAELGRMVSDGRAYVFTYPWIVTAPGLAILLASLGFNLVGDAARDIFDPRLRR
jgi:peptide/nickel transport system permease protein